MDDVLGKWITSAEITQSFGLSKGTIYQMAQKGMFPRGVKFGHSRRWELKEVQAWIEERIKEAEKDSV